MKILITGGSSEIAMALAKRRVMDGDEVLVTASSQESLGETLAAYAEAGITARGFVFDLGTPESAAAEVDRHAKGLEAVVLNAASRVPKLKLIHELPQGEIDAYVRANVLGNVWLLNRLLPGMIERKFGRIIFVSSVTAAVGTSRYGVYCLAKSALEGLCLNLAVDYGEHGILTNIVRPGIVATERTKRFWKRTHYAERAREIIPQRELGTPEQVAEAMDPLFSPTSYMNGSVVTVSGGMPMMRSAGVLDL